ncbi:uncharacterized protein LOC131434397 [Malaya genurostris]|uniref:uncharacterized protein LOC131434397 n=1 Tax=Malaya genurostris TaxID=325434 RepID=UPI0026F38E72|nr:uncharacterized protein LOC131434397 [Malaya genurostris]
MPAASKQKSPPLKALQTKLRGLQTSFNNMYQFMQLCRTDTKLVEVNVRLEQLDPMWDKMIEALDELESHEETPDNTEDFVKDRIDFENRFYELKSFLVDKIKEDGDTSALNQTTRSLDNAPTGSTPHVRLPQITLPKFDGKIDEWLTFRDLYTSLIHWQADLPDIEKFHYLRSQLEGEALAVIDSLPLTKANYTVAWELLTKRYSNTKVLRKRQVQALFELPFAKRECAADLHSLLDTFEKIVKTLDQVTPQQADYKDMLLLHLLSSRLDNATRRSWEEWSSTKDIDTVKDLTEFLQRHIRILESLPNRSTDQKMEPSQSKYPKKASTVKAFNTTVQNPSASAKCVACSCNHPLYQCQSFHSLPVPERDALLRSNSLCRNCFRRGHHAKDCNSKFTCRQCKGKHHTLVCFKGKANEGKPNNNTDLKASDKSEEIPEAKVVNLATTTNTTLSCNTTTSSTGVLLLTAVVILEDDQGHKVHARALLDSAAECNLISKRLRKYLSVKEESSMVEVVGIQGLATKVHGKITVHIHSRVSDFKQTMEMFVLTKIAAQMNTALIDAAKWNIPSGIELADPNILQDDHVDLVLGAEFFFEFFSSNRRIRLGDNLPSLVDSVFGWVVTGRYAVNAPTKSVLCDVALTSRLEDMLERFWKCEDVGLETNYSPEETRCENYFLQTTQRDASGRYIVSYPRIDELLTKLGESKAIAERRFLQLERRLGRDVELQRQYKAFMLEYETLGHMRLVSQEEKADITRCYLPHHPVVKNESTTTKVRVVFDASAKTASNLSLNDSLCVGPTIQEDLRSIILRSRTRQIMLVADIEKMFRQVEVCPQDRPLQSILWRTSANDPLSTYELATVTYGTKPAPFLATRTLVQLASDEETRFPLAATAVREDFYMDDAITGADDANTAKELRIQLQSMLELGGFKLRKFASNCETVLSGLPKEDLSIQTDDGISLDNDCMVKTLGLIWMPHTDVFRFKFDIIPLHSSDRLTKRKVLSIIATLFDPLGLIGAVITRAKIFMQLLWQLEDSSKGKLAWDSPLPTNVAEEWIRFHQQLPSLNNIRVERLVMLKRPKSSQIHIFCDASQKAYGACAYIRSEDVLERIKVALLSSKSRVSPLKTQTIPKLELCGALLAAELYSKINRSNSGKDDQQKLRNHSFVPALYERGCFTSPWTGGSDDAKVKSIRVSAANGIELFGHCSMSFVRRRQAGNLDVSPKRDQASAWRQEMNRYAYCTTTESHLATFENASTAQLQ